MGGGSIVQIHLLLDLYIQYSSWGQADCIAQNSFVIAESTEVQAFMRACIGL